MVPLIIGFTIASCCSNAFNFETLVKRDAQITTVLTFLQYVFIFLSLSVYLNMTGFWMKKFERRYNPWSIKYLVPIIIQNVCASLSNYVFNYNMSMATHIIIKSLGPPATLILGRIFWGKRYGVNKMIGSTLIAFGSGLFTISVEENSDRISGSNDKIGVFLLISLVLVSSMTSLYTSEIYQSKSLKADWKLVMYYNYLIGLLLYLPLIGVISSSLKEFAVKSTDYQIILWNLVTQLFCVIGVNILTFKLTALTLSLTLIIRRFLSLFISIYLFEAPVNRNGVVGVVLVLTGSFIYSLPSGNTTQSRSLKKQK